MLEKGRYIRIFQKPLTMEDFEGNARLVEKISEDELSERWKVTFNEEKEIVERIIAKYQDLNWDDYKLNMRVVLINRRADVRLADVEKCPGPIDSYGNKKLETGDCNNCYFFMGCHTSPDKAFVGVVMLGCCWKLILIKKGFLKIA